MVRGTYVAGLRVLLFFDISVGGGLRCAAPPSYVGKCSNFLDNVHVLSKEAKVKLENDCGVKYPCKEELSASQGAGDSTQKTNQRPQMTLWFLQNGAIQS